MKEYKSVCVFTENRILFQKILLELSDKAVCRLCPSDEYPKDADMYLADTEYPNAPETALKMGDGGDIPLPFRIGTLRALLLEKNSDTEKLTLISDGRYACVGVRKIKLTEIEFSLLSAIYENRGKFISRRELVKKVWGEGHSDGVLNVYIHYLREKIECGKEKIIICSRGAGYKISDSFLEVPLCSE